VEIRIGSLQFRSDYGKKQQTKDKNNAHIPRWDDRFIDILKRDHIGIVEVFDLIGHPKTHRVYAWAHEAESGKRRHNSASHSTSRISKTAVRAAIIQEYRNNA
jgi:hypothetical protein